MKKPLLLVALFFSLLGLYLFCSRPSWAHFSGEQYQDIIIGNRVVKKASGQRRDCESRYSLIRQVLDKYERPFAVLDIGANLGYYSFRIANDYDATSVMIEGNNPAYPKIGDQLFKLCKMNRLDNVIYLNKVVSIEDLQRLSECENFGVTLALNIIHWFGPRWKEVTDVILQLGDNAIIETPPEEPIASKEENERRRAIEEYLVQRGAKILGQVPRHTSETFSNVYLYEGSKTELKRKTWICPVQDKGQYFIHSNYQIRTLTKVVSELGTTKTIQWTPGINLLTFKMYHGIYPEAKTLKKAIRKLSNRRNNDCMVNNMILCGNKICLIDRNDRRHHTDTKRCSRKRLKAHLKLMDLDAPEQVETYFWEKLAR